MQTLVIGRDIICNIVLSDNFVSRQHAQLTFFDNGQVLLKDLGSSNGTFVNGKRIIEINLKSGDIVKLANSIVYWQDFQDQSVQNVCFSSQLQQQSVENCIEVNNNQSIFFSKRKKSLLAGILAFLLILVLLILGNMPTEKKANKYSKIFQPGYNENTHELTREYAKSQINTKYSFPYYQKGDFELVFYNVLAYVDVPEYDKLQAGGYITYNLDGWWRTAQITENGKQYVLGQARDEGFGRTYISVRTCTIEFGEITGIQTIPEQNLAVVTYTIRRTNVTPFGDIIFQLKNGDIPKQISFAKFDNGWRIAG